MNAVVAIPAAGAALALAMAVVFSLAARDGGRFRSSRFALLLSAYLGANILLLLSEDLLLSFVLLKVITCLTAAVLLHARDKHAPGMAYKYLVMAVIGGFFQLVGVSILARFAGGTGYDALLAIPALGSLETSLVHVSLVLVVIGFGTEIAIFPLHWWLPDIYTFAPASTVGFLNVKTVACTATLVRILMLVSATIPAAGITCVLLGLASVIAGGLLAFQQRVIMRAVAFVSIFEQGCVLLACSPLSTAAHHAALFYLVNGVIVKIGLVLALGSLRHDGTPVQFRERHGPSPAEKVAAIAFLVCALSLGGTPPTSGFLAKLVFLNGVASFFAPSLGIGWAVSIVVLVVAFSFIVLFTLVHAFHVTFIDQPPGGVVGRARASLLPAPLVALAFTFLLGLFPVLAGLLFFPA